jgi:hypothetical protein
MKTFLYVLITNFVFAEIDETVVKSNVCVNIVFSALTGGRLELKTHLQGAHEALFKKQVQGR